MKESICYLISLELTPAYDNTFRKVIGITNHTSGKINMRNKELSIKRGIAKFGEKSIIVITKENTQVHNKEVFESIEKQNLNDEIKAKAFALC